MEHLTDPPASQQRTCPRCGKSGHIDTLALCRAGHCVNPCGEPAVGPVSRASARAAWNIARARVQEEREPGLTAHQALNLIGHVLSTSSSAKIAFVRHEDDGVSFYTQANGRLQRWLLTGEGLSEYPL